MALHWDFEDQPDHLFVRVDGQWQIQSVLKLIDAIAGRCRDGGHVRVLADCREMRGPVGELDRYLSGTHVASALGPIKLAVVVSADAVITRFGMNVAERRGGRLLSTKSFDEARQWLFDTD
jgi:hypothetical protein